MKESIYQYISKMAETYPRLPYEFQDISQAGARDTNYILWGDRLKITEQRKLAMELMQEVIKVMYEPDAFSRITEYLDQKPIFLYMEKLSSRIKLMLGEKLLDKEKLYNIAIRLATESEYEEEVKLGILLLGFFENDITRRIIKKLGLHSTFTIYAVEASQNFENPNEFQFTLLINTEGYGKLAALTLFEPVLQNQKKWLFKYGARNMIAPNISSIMCLEKVDMADFYHGLVLDETTFSDLSFLLAYAGEQEDIKRFTHGRVLVEKYIEAAKVYAKSFIDLSAVVVIEKSMAPYWYDRDVDVIKENSWSSNLENEIRNKCKEILKKSIWTNVVYQELENPYHPSSLIIMVLECLQLLVPFHTLIPMLQKNSFDIDLMRYLLIDNYHEYLHVTLDYLMMALPWEIMFNELLDIEVEDADVSFRPDVWLVFLLKALRNERRYEEEIFIKCLSERFPDVRIEAIHGLRVFKLEWSERVIPSLEKALENEPVDKIRRRLMRLLGKSNQKIKEQRYIDVSDINIKPMPWDICLIEINIAGTFYRDMLVVEGRIEKGDVLYLVREPNNEYDPNAILVTAEDGYIIGYVPRKDNQMFAYMMDSGEILYAVLKSESIDVSKPVVSIMLRRQLDKEDNIIQFIR
ncbi:MAG TPA: hypothetical protein GX002_00055 [Clostridiales bacterium]|jgi:hypothetical protein|nr:hypothetical protein [Clostridiales bacterium]